MTIHRALGTLAAPHDSALHRRYLLSGAVWFLLATALLLAACVQHGLNVVLATPLLAAGRLGAAYKVAVLWGALSLPMAGALSALHAADEPDARTRGWSEAGLWLWNAGIFVGVVAVLLGLRSPGSWGGAPWWSLALMLAGAALWVATFWIAVSGRERQHVSAWFALTACVVLLASLTIGLAASGPMSGVPRALADIMHGRLALAGWLPLGCFASAAAVLPATYGRPLYSRRALWWGLWSWFTLAVVLAVAPMHADLLPGWLSRPMTGVAVLQAAPAVLVAVGLLGTWVGHPARLPSSAASWLLTIAVGGVVASAIASAGLASWQTGDVQFTALSVGPGLFPLAAALVLAVVGATYACLDDGHGTWAVAPKVHGAIAVTGAVLSAAVVWPLGLAQAAIGTSDALLRVSYAAMLPVAVVLFVSALVWVVNVGARSSNSLASNVTFAARTEPSSEGAAAVTVVGIAAVVLAGALFVSLFLPIVDPVMSRLSPRSGARDLMPGSLADIGRTVYVADGCEGCHTQRVRPAPADTGTGPATEPGDFALSPALVGFRRAGPDLAWIGDRYPDRTSMTQAMAAHGSAAAAPMPWLIEADGPTSKGQAVIEYLVGLNSSAGVRP